MRIERIVESLDDLEVGQRLMFTDAKRPETNGVYRVAFIDPPEAILKSEDGDGWPRIAWQMSDFRLPHARLVILEPTE